MDADHSLNQKNVGHKKWVKTSHWIVTLSFLSLAITGILIVMVHPRFYWGEVGNDLTPALFELPIGRNYKHGGWEKSVPIYNDTAALVSARRTYDIFNQNGWGRSLHFLSAWLLVITGIVYILFGIITGHFRRHILPKLKELSPQMIWRDVVNHIHMRIPRATHGPQYGLLQKCTYAGVIFIALPLVVITGLTMSPAITAAYPFLLELFGGFQSARTLHFIASIALELFVILHVLMIIKSGFKKQMNAMTIDK